MLFSVEELSIPRSMDGVDGKALRRKRNDPSGVS
jgi:hypothetical protein